MSYGDMNMDAPDGLWHLDSWSPGAGAVCVGFEGVALVKKVWGFKVTYVCQFTICLVMTVKDVDLLGSVPPAMSAACCHTFLLWWTLTPLESYTK